jgi:hypothetical protein
MKKAKLVSSLSFLLFCMDHIAILRFLQFCHHIPSQFASRIYVNSPAFFVDSLTFEDGIDR